MVFVGKDVAKADIFTRAVKLWLAAIFPRVERALLGMLVPIYGRPSTAKADTLRRSY
jgi:hypothetical protein